MVFSSLFNATAIRLTGTTLPKPLASIGMCESGALSSRRGLDGACIARTLAMPYRAHGA